MGLDTTHGCWNGPYSSFNRWRTQLAAEIGYPLPLMDGFCPWFVASAPFGDATETEVASTQLRKYPPIPWPPASEEPLVVLLSHSDCEGVIDWTAAPDIANRLDQVVKKARSRQGMSAPTGPERADYDGFIPACERFATGLREAYAARENVVFH